MSDQYGGMSIPVDVPTQVNAFPPESVPGDPFIGYFANFLKTMITEYAGDVWGVLAPGIPIVRTTFAANDPTNIFNEAALPALYVWRPGRETREAIEKFEQTADDYRFAKTRVEVLWILSPASQLLDRKRNSITDALRKVIDRAVSRGRDPRWQVPNDPDPKAAQWGSSLCNFSGAAVIELNHGGPFTYVHDMELPAKKRRYDALKLSFDLEELLMTDITTFDPNNEVLTEYVSPDQGTGLGNFDLGDGIYR